MSEKNAITNATQNARFDPGDPFPHIALAEISYQEAQAHAAEVDLWLDLHTIETEEKLGHYNEDQELWIGLPIQSLLTPYIEFRQIFEILKLQGNETLIDCGAGYGRMGFVLARHFPQVNFIGFELVEERVREAQRCLALQGCNKAQMICANIDLPGFSLPDADIYFIYDFSHRRAIDRLLDRLQAIARNRKIIVVARGRSSRDAIDHERPWLSQVVEPEHFPNFSIYRS